MPNPKTRTSPHNLPASISSFIGRQRELAEVLQLLRTERLVTLTGAGGSGKTRLALRAASETLASFEDGAWLIELAPLADGALVPQAAASVLGVREQPGRELADTLRDHLKDRRLLLVLDNCEHIVQACAQFAESLLQACPSLTILATSREPLGIAGEVVRIIPPLSLPPTSAATGESEAVQLLVARGQAAAPGFHLTDENALAVAEVCRRLDGMPLAIELAAARLRSLSIQQVAELLTDRFQLLTGGSRTAPARQRTLEATLEWSYALLSDEERQLPQRAAVFAGGFTLTAAQAVCAGGDLAAAQVVDVLSHLVEKSLIVPEEAAGEVRYRMLETIREYALKKLAASGGMEAARDLHLEYFAQWAKKLEPLLLGPELARGVQLFAADHDNVRQALDWSENSSGNAQAGLRLAASAWNYWRVVGYHSEGRARLGSLLARPEAQAPTIARADALHCAALHAFYQSDYPACKSICEQGKELYERLGHAGRNGLANCLELSAEVASETGEYQTAFGLYERALPIYEELGDLTGLGDTLKMLGFHSMRSGDLESAERWLRRGLDVCRQTGDQRHISSGLSGLGEWYIRMGRYKEARKTLNESLAISRSTGEKWNIAINLGSLGWVSLMEGDRRQMAVELRESLSIRMETGDRGGMAWCLEKLGQAAAMEDKHESAALAFGAAAALRRPVGSEMDKSDRPVYESSLERVREALGEGMFAERWAAGENMPANQVIELALALFETPVQHAAGSGAMPGGLTARELEVASLIAQGRSNKEIAEAMTVGVKTVETYVTRILGKLGFDSRVQVATWAVEHGLLKKEER